MPLPVSWNDVTTTLYFRSHAPTLESWVWRLQDTIRQTFGECGDIKSVRFAEDRETGEFRGFGHVEFYDGEHVDAAMKLANSDVMGRPIRVRFFSKACCLLHMKRTFL